MSDNSTTTPDITTALHRFDQQSNELPVLVKDQYYLSRLERELARAAVSKNQASKNKGVDKGQDKNQNPDAATDKQSKAAHELAKNGRSTIKSKPARSWQYKLVSTVFQKIWRAH